MLMCASTKLSVGYGVEHPSDFAIVDISKRDLIRPH